MESNTPYNMQFRSGILMLVGHWTLHEGYPIYRVLSVCWNLMFKLLHEDPSKSDSLYYDLSRLYKIWTMKQGYVHPTWGACASTRNSPDIKSTLKADLAFFEDNQRHSKTFIPPNFKITETVARTIRQSDVQVLVIDPVTVAFLWHCRQRSFETLWETRRQS